MKKQARYLYTDISGNAINYFTYEYGQGDKKLYIQGGVHGGETTYYIFNELHNFLLKHEKSLQGKILLAPMINPVAWSQRIYYYTIGKFDLYKGADWNRSYPGAETTMSARNSRIIYDIAKEYKVCIDLHTARISKPYTIFHDKKILPLLKIFGLPYNFFIDVNDIKNIKYKGMFSKVFGKRGFTCECGSHDNFDLENIEEVLNGIKRLLIYLNLLSDTNICLPSNRVSYLFNKVFVLYSEASGFVKYNTAPRKKFENGQSLCTILDSSQLGKTIAVKAPYEGVMFELAKSSIVWTGDELFRVINKNDIEQI